MASRFRKPKIRFSMVGRSANRRHRRCRRRARCGPGDPRRFRHGVRRGILAPTHSLVGRSSIYQIPLLRLQITPVFRDNTTNRLELHLTNNSLVPQATTGGSSGMSCELSELALQWQGDAYILCNYLDQRQDGKYVWLQWSKDHSELAERLWPAVARAARSRLYAAVPDLMRLSETATHPDQLDSSSFTALGGIRLARAETSANGAAHAGPWTYFAKHSPWMGTLPRRCGAASRSTSAVGRQKNQRPTDPRRPHNRGRQR